jgi:DnaJ-class molecular chaperone
MAKRDLYEVLGVARDAPAEEIKRAYRKLAKQHHPDRNLGNASAEQKFKELQHAYSILSDKEKRARYDQYGEIGAGDFHTQPGGQRVYTWGPSGQQINVEDLEELFSAFGAESPFAGASPFERFFRGGRTRRQRRPAPVRGQDTRRRINLAFEQAIRGVNIEVDLGQRAGGKGKRETIEVRIPPGVEDGQQIRVRGQGTPGVGGGPPGDLFLICAVRPHRFFRREGRNVAVEVPVTVSEAALGAKIDVPTLDGEVTLTIPPGTSGGTKLRLRGRGVPKHGSEPAGDQIAVVQVLVPKSLSEKQKALFEELAASLEETDPRAALKG